ncbi:NO signaling/Golgi transport ligand-binding domain-containing protein [Hyaloraphidium curvatum]|nr:NO signaling/Golgi transport ligand-binding domain-containing protein [Hyaloraphidium curvatum]
MSATPIASPASAPQYNTVTLTPTDPGQRFVADAVLELLLAECVDAFHRDVAAAAQLGTDIAGGVAQLSLAGANGAGGRRAPRSGAPVRSAEDLDELTENEREQAYYKLENMGYRVGMAFVERATRDRPRFIDTLDVVKFICKEFWTSVFRKQVDNLKTNHKGVYVLTDNQFRWFMRMSTDGGMAETIRKSFPHLAFPCGLIRGALANLGIPSVVLAEVTALPACTFQIKVTEKPASVVRPQ